MTNKALTILLLIVAPFSSSILVEEHHWDLPQYQRNGIQQTLAGGRYVTSTDVQNILDLSRDLAAFDNAQDAAEVDRIYREGRSVGNAENGTDRITLASIALNRMGVMVDTPTFATYKYTFEMLGKSFGDQNGDFMGRPSQNFADTIVSGLLARHDFSKEVVKEAVLVFHMWLSATFELNNVWTECEANHDSTAAMAALDRVAAFWFGDDENGESLSKLADLVSREAFGQAGDEVWANTQIFNALEFLKVFLEDGSSCVGNNGGKAEIRESVDRIRSSMTIPLVQNLIHNMFSTENESLTRVYVFAVQPQVMSCDPEKADALRIDNVPSTTDEQKLAWAKEVQGALSCMRLDCEEIGNYTRSSTYPTCNESSNVALAGYEPFSVDAKYFSYLDRDLERLHVLLNQGAYSSAQNLYTQGHHAPFSLQALATNHVIHPRIDSKRESLQNNSTTDQEIQRALSFQSEFRGLSSEELSSVVLGLLSYQASHDSILSAFEAAMASCQENQGVSSIQPIEYWDIGAALYIGSLEGPLKGGSMKGRLLYGASKDFCRAFDSCVERNSKINELVIESFTVGKQYLTTGDCPSLENVTRNVMIPALQTVLVQGSLYFASRATILEGGSQDGTLGSVHVFGRSILPQVRASNEESGTVLQDVLLIPNQRVQSVDAFLDAAEAIQIALQNMTSDCDQIGTLQLFNLSLCDDIENQRPVNNLVFGRYVFGDRKQANQLSSVALDIRDMNRASSIKESMEIYENGLNVAGDVEVLRGSKLSLSALSRVATTFMSQDHLFNIYKFALYDIHDFEEGSSENFTFADDFILKSAVNATDKEIIAQACIALNIWMMVSHHLHQAVRLCTAQEIASSDIDAAVALWIGKDQVQGSFTHGWSLYSLSQTAAQIFGAPEGEAIANTQILKVFNNSQTISNTCLDDPFAHYQLRAQVLEALRLLSIPLVQLLLAATASEHQIMISLFATSVLPQFAGCSPTLYKDLSGVLLEDFNTTRVDQGFVDKMTAFLDCVGVSCSDLAFTDLAPLTLQTLIGSLCSSDATSSRSDFQYPAYASASLIERDILQVGALMLTRANRAAIDLYQYGRNALILSSNNSLWTNDGDMAGVLTLRQLATLQASSPMEGLIAFNKFYGSPEYPNELAKQGIQGKGVYRNESLTLLANDSVSILEVVVGFQGVVWFLEQTTFSCINSEYEAASQYWELAMGLFNGATGSYSLRSLSNQICESFGTCIDARHSVSILGKSIDELMGIAYAWIDETNCDKVDHMLTSEIMPLLMSLLLQGLIGKTLDIDNTELEPNFPSGFVLSQALLPLIANVSSESADTIAFLFDSPSSTVQSEEDIDIFLEAVQDVVLGMGIVCPYLGSWLANPTLVFCSEHEAPKPIAHSNLGLDVKEIRKALSNGNIEVARSIYINGKYALDDGEPTALQHLSIHGNIDMSDEPVFELFRHGNHGHHAYADAFVWQAFSAEAESSNMLASDTIVAMNVWMGTIHFMTQAVIACHYEENQVSVDSAIHQATGLYVGDASPEEDDKPGNLLFGLADAMKIMFAGIGDNVPSASINTKMLTLFTHADMLIRSSNDACSGNSTTASELNALLHDMTRQMTIPLVQGLVNALKTTDQDRVQLYARTIMPLISQCNEQDYRFFESDLIAGPLQVADVEANIDRIYQALPCLGLTCNDVGQHITDTRSGSAMTSRPGCEAKGKTKYSGYEPFDTRDFEEALRIDQDLREIQFLLLGSSIEAASYIYQYGRHGTTSLKQLQETIVRSSMSFTNSVIQSFVSYYEDNDYVEKLVWDPLHNGSFMGETLSTNEERENLAIGFAQMVLLPHGALTSMQLAWAHCEAEQDIESILRSWDHGAAYLLGSSSVTGSGRLSPQNLAETTCSSFDTCPKGGGEGGWNNRLVELLNVGRSALNDNSCSVLPQIITALQSLLLVPVIQETLRASLSAKTMYRAYVASRAIVPLLAPKEAARLESLFPQSVGKYDSTIPPAAMNLLSTVLNDLGIDCKWIGKLNGMDACSSNNVERFHTSPSGLLPAAWTGIVLGTAVLIAAVVYCCCKSQGSRAPQLKRAVLSDDQEIDTNLFGKSFRSKTNAASFKAKRALDRISLYGDDSETVFPVRTAHSNSSGRSGKTQGSPRAVCRLTSSASSTSSIFLEGNDDML